VSGKLFIPVYFLPRRHEGHEEKKKEGLFEIESGAAPFPGLFFIFL